MCLRSCERFSFHGTFVRMWLQVCKLHLFPLVCLCGSLGTAPHILDMFRQIQFCAQHSDTTFCVYGPYSNTHGSPPCMELNLRTGSRTHISKSQPSSRIDSRTNISKPHPSSLECRSEATQVVNGGGAGGPLSALSKCPAYKKVTGFKPVFLDNKTGRTYSRDGDTWKYCCNIGICLSRVSNTKSTRKLQNASFPRQMHFHASKNKVPCQIAKTCFRHKLFEGISAAEFEITLNDRWVIMQQHQSPRPDLRFNVLAHNHSTPLIIECANVCGLRFSVHPTLSQTTTILQNWVDMKIKETFEKGHIDRRFHADDNRHVYISPNSAQQRQRAKSARRTRGQFAAKHANADWKPLDSRARTKLRPQSACDARPPRSDLRARSTPTSTSSSRSKTANHAKPKLVVSTGGSARSASNANSSPTSGSRKTVRTPPSRQARKGKVSANSYLCQFSGQSSNGTVVIRNIKVAKRYIKKYSQNPCNRSKSLVAMVVHLIELKA